MAALTIRTIFVAKRLDEQKIRRVAQQLVSGEQDRERAMKELTAQEKAALWTELDFMAQRAAGLATYVLARGSDGGLDMGHAIASQREAIEVNTLRSVMGYAIEEKAS